MKRTVAVVSGGLVLLSAQASFAAGLGIPLDGFLSQFQTWVIGLGLIMGLVGLTGYVGAQFDNPFSHILAGSVGFFTRAGLLGGGTVLLGLMGLGGGDSGPRRGTVEWKRTVGLEGAPSAVGAEGRGRFHRCRNGG